MKAGWYGKAKRTIRRWMQRWMLSNHFSHKGYRNTTHEVDMPVVRWGASTAHRARCRGFNMWQCPSGDINRRCACLKTEKSCTKDCQCHQCQNPLNGLDAAHLSLCVIQNIHAYKALTQDELDA